MNGSIHCLYLEAENALIQCNKPWSCVSSTLSARFSASWSKSTRSVEWSKFVGRNLYCQTSSHMFCLYRHWNRREQTLGTFRNVYLVSWGHVEVCRSEGLSMRWIPCFYLSPGWWMVLLGCNLKAPGWKPRLQSENICHWCSLLRRLCPSPQSPFHQSSTCGLLLSFPDPSTCILTLWSINSCRNKTRVTEHLLH